MRCPICDKNFDPSESAAPPFCSERCRTIDLGRWLGETYSMPVTDIERDESPADEPQPENGVDRETGK